MAEELRTEYDPEKRLLLCRGDWDVHRLQNLQAILSHTAWPDSGAVKIDGHGINKMDSAGAWLLSRWQSKLEKNGLKIRLLKFSPEAESLLSIVTKEVKDEAPLPIIKVPEWMARIGIQTIQQITGFKLYLSFVGKLTFEALRMFSSQGRFRWNSLASIIYRNGFQALPIITLLSFMIGVVITYQMGLQLKNYGANIYIVDLLGLSVLREFGPLMTAIMVAGRTGSAYTAELGIMKINREIDALDTMGVTSGELLLLPRIFGLFLVLPLLTVWADVFGVFGGMVMSNNMLNITWYDFVQRFPHVIPLRAFIIGIGKAPVFALIIASIGCYQGVRVGGSADSVGVNTTRSVVLSIFFIIVADALFSILFSKLKL